MQFIRKILILLLLIVSSSHLAYSNDNELLSTLASSLKKNDLKTVLKYSINNTAQFNDSSNLIINDLLKALAQANAGRVTETNQTIENLRASLHFTPEQIKNEAIIKGIKGILNYRLKNYNIAIDSINKAILILDSNIRINKFDKYFLAYFYRFLGRSYSETGTFIQAISVIDKSSKLFLELNNIENTYVNDKYMGRVYIQSNKYLGGSNDIAILKYNIALQGFKKSQMTEEIPWIYTIISDYYIRNKETKLAKAYQDSAIATTGEKEYLLKGLSYNNLGEIYEIEGKTELAKEHYLKAIEIYSKIYNYSNKSFSYYNVARLYYYENNSALALQNIDSSLKYAIKTHSLYKQQLAYQLYSDIYKQDLNFKKAYYYLEKSTVLSDSLLQHQNRLTAHSYNSIFKQAKRKRKIKNFNLQTNYKKKKMQK